MKILLLILISFSLYGCKNIDKYRDEHFIMSNNQVEVYSDTHIYDLFSTKDIEVINKNELIDTTKLGKHTYQVSYKYENKKYTYDIEYEVVDTEAPRYFGGTYKTIKKNYDGDLCNLVLYGDNYDGDLDCTIKGEYNLGQEGTYKVIYVITDKSNNSTNIECSRN